MKRFLLYSLIINLTLFNSWAQGTGTEPSINVTLEGDGSSLSTSRQMYLSNFDITQVPTDVIYDKVTPISKIENYTGSISSKTLNLTTFKQIYFELSKASFSTANFVGLESVALDQNVNASIPIGLINYNYSILKEDALERGLVQEVNGKLVQNPNATESPFNNKRVFAASALMDHSCYGSQVRFKLNSNGYVTNTSDNFKKIEINFDDGRGFQTVNFDQDVAVSYSTIGNKTITVRTTDLNNLTLTSSSIFQVLALSAPSYTNISLTADISYNGVKATGNAYIYKSPKNASVKNPVIILEGIDLDNSRFADELYTMLNQQKLAENLLNNGYDIIIVNYTESKTYIQANAMVVVKAIQYVNNLLKVGKNSNILIGASMGGLVGRYALRYMELHPNTGDHQTRLFTSFDSPQKGANIPLGDQYWINFFADESGDAAKKIGQLNSIAPQQMLVYHHLTFPYTSSYRTTFQSELNSMGYPQKSRNIAITNGSANGIGEPYNPGDQLISYRYRHWKVDIDGNTWAVPKVDNTWKEISHCRINPFGPLNERKHYVSVMNTYPYDNAPGGFRSTNKEIADSETEYGDITSPNPNHCFIPTVSALDINTSDLFYNIKNDPNILSKTPFNAIYYPVSDPNTNQAHVAITSETVGWVFNELVPDNIVLNGNTRNAGDIKAKYSIKFATGFKADANSQLHAYNGTYTITAAKAGKVENTTITESNPVIASQLDGRNDDQPIKIFPNPSNGIFNIMLPSDDKAQIEIRSITGTLVYKTVSASKAIKINMPNCANGLYTVKISTSKGQQFINKILINK